MPYYTILHDRRPRRVLVTPPNALPLHSCEVCGAACAVARNHHPVKVIGFDVPELFKTHDRWYCPQDHYPWHERLAALEDERKSFHSERLRDLIDNEIDELRRTFFKK